MFEWSVIVLLWILAILDVYSSIQHRRGRCSSAWAEWWRFWQGLVYVLVCFFVMFLTLIQGRFVFSAFAAFFAGVASFAWWNLESNRRTRTLVFEHITEWVVDTGDR